MANRSSNRAGIRGSKVLHSPPVSSPVSKQVAGDLALDFCNTAGEHLSTQPQEKLLNWELFLRWSMQVGLIDSETYADLVLHASPIDPIVELRETIYRVGLSLARKTRVSSKDLLLICENANAARPPVIAQDSRLAWRFDRQHASSQLRGILASDALALFCSPRAARIGICEGGHCGWLFLDDSRGQRRRWCDMKDCGNAAKARRYYQRKQKNE